MTIASDAPEGLLKSEADSPPSFKSPEGCPPRPTGQGDNAMVTDAADPISG